VAASSRLALETIAELDLRKALQRGFETARQNGLLVITGSIYLVGAALSELQSEP